MRIIFFKSKEKKPHFNERGVDMTHPLYNPSLGYIESPAQASLRERLEAMTPDQKAEYDRQIMEGYKTYRGA